jgi:putative ABC transport system permease protein
MFKNYFKTSLRSLVRNKSYSFINISGLAIGIACFILIMLWVENEYSYNHFIPNHEQLYDVKVNTSSNGSVHTDPNMCIPAYEALKHVDTQVENTCFTGSTYGHALAYDGKIFNKEALGVSPEFLEMFNLPMVKGSYNTALIEPYSIMLNESTAKEMFGDEEPIGKFIRIENNSEVKVTAVFKDVPRNSTFWFHALLPIAYFEGPKQWVTTASKDWNQFDFHVYVQLQPDADIGKVNGRIKDLLKNHSSDGAGRALFLHAMDRWHLYTSFVNGKEAGGPIEYVRLFTWIAAIILLIACINYMNLATARSEKRAKEIGIRKTIGSHRSELVIQFLLESFLVTGVSFVVAIIVAAFCLPAYNVLVHRQLSLHFNSSQFWLFTLCLVVVTGLLAGFYPAFYFSSFQPAKVLKGKVHIGRNAGLPRKIMITVQYVFSIFLVVAMVVIYQQLQHVRNRELGYDKENLIMIAYNDDIGKNFATIKNELLKTGRVEAVNRSSTTIYQDYFTDFVDWPGKPTEEKVLFVSVDTDNEYVETMGIKIIEGRNFSEFASDSTAVLVNRTAVRTMGLKDPVGQIVKINKKELTIVGVVDDVLMGSPYEPIAPLVVNQMGRYFNYVNIRLTKGKSLQESIQKVDETLKRFDPAHDSEIMFPEEGFRDKLTSIELIGKLANLFAVLAIALTGLGVFGLAAYTAEQRTKEMAIRKVLGAGVNDLVLLLSNYFTRISIFAAMLAAPLAWWVMDKYLERYPYRVAVPWWSIPLTAIVMLTITLFIVGAQVVRVAHANPINRLKTE